MCKGRLKKWEIHKYNTEERVRDFLGQVSDGGAREAQAKSRKVDKYLRRKKMTADALLASHDKKLEEYRQAPMDDSADPEVDDMSADTEDPPSLAAMADDDKHKPLLSVVQDTLGELGVDFGTSSSVDGLLLLQHRAVLQDRLSELRGWSWYRLRSGALLHELELLVGRVLCNGDMFKSFGYEELKERGIIDEDLLETYSRQNLDASAGGLNEAFRQGFVSDSREEFIKSSFGCEELKERGIVDETLLDTAPRQNIYTTEEGLDDIFCSTSITRLRSMLKRTFRSHQDFDAFAGTLDKPLQKHLRPDSLEEVEGFTHTWIHTDDRFSYRLWLDPWMVREEIPRFSTGLWETLLNEPLSISAVEENAFMVREYLLRGCSPDNLVVYAASINDTASVRFLLGQGADANDALTTASRFGSQSSVDVVLGHGGDVNCIAKNGSPLSAAAKYGQHSLASNTRSQGFNVAPMSIWPSSACTLGNWAPLISVMLKRCCGSFQGRYRRPRELLHDVRSIPPPKKTCAIFGIVFSFIMGL
ncbi:uncharacterized protein GLRG_00467 [Colletotrichum graminicola M1.001]|uniref:Ankyrin repeat protein n=1 Tax=Colletotrichum graminicola (strain M1.001 / M2 / FGSC 10212) TaxID=645133 RepID=E3Q2M2_COLGM|nr:uncharacterized protein GLRG_00467 [Colletotrichum graminicola M1.001]EFQ25323.1 hypothetical protein GLRG_00467 [Colletotrichum graminicola M1.001]